MWAALISPKRDIGDAGPGESTQGLSPEELVEPLESIARNFFLGGSVEIARQLRKRRGPSSSGGGPLARVRIASCFI